MSSTGYTSEYLTALEEAIAQGAVSLSYEGKQVTYRSLRDMLTIRDLIRAELGLSKRKKRNPRRFVSGRFS